jgi:hypothetical protein
MLSFLPQKASVVCDNYNCRYWRTRPDPFAEVWAEEIEPLLRRDPDGVMRATTILEWLEERYPGRFNQGQIRSLQRRLRDWRAIHGPDREVFFPQEHPPGREAQLDFTHGQELRVTIGGEPFPHLFFELCTEMDYLPQLLVQRKIAPESSSTKLTPMLYLNQIHRRAPRGQIWKNQ